MFGGRVVDRVPGAFEVFSGQLWVEGPSGPSGQGNRRGLKVYCWSDVILALFRFVYVWGVCPDLQAMDKGGKWIFVGEKVLNYRV